MAKSKKKNDMGANLGFEANPPFNDSDWGGEHLREDVRDEAEADRLRSQNATSKTIVLRKILVQVGLGAPAWPTQFAVSRKVEKSIRSNSEGLKYDG